MGAVNGAEWLMAIDAHPETFDTDLVVAVAISNGETTVDGVDPEAVDDSFGELIALGFLESVLVTDHAEGEEHLLEFRYS